jgi:hypothetical protein
MSKPITVSIPHDLGKAEARKRLEAGFDRFGQQFGEGVQLSKTWVGDRLSFAAKVMGNEITGHLDVQDAAVLMEVVLPGMLGMIAGKIKGRLQKEGQILLEAPKKP